MNVSILIISNNDDFSTDMVCSYMHKNKFNYLRINRDDLPSYKVNWDISKMQLTLQIDNHTFTINSSLKAIYYRAPTFLRESFYKHCSFEEQIKLSQWMAFIRNLMCFENVFWMNNPQDIYRAENKLYQLLIADSVGLKTPKTFIQNNHKNIENEKLYAVKSIDTAIFGDEQSSYFSYTKILTGKELKCYKLNIAPICLQDYIEEKIDIRVTYIDGNIYASSITNEDKSVYGDWRLQKTNLKYSAYELPNKICEQIKQFMTKLNLSFGGIDLMYSHNNYYFVEVNPTGEWAWLVEPCSYDFPKIIGDTLLRRPNET